MMRPKLNDFQKKLTDLIQPQIGFQALKSDYIRDLTEAFPEDQIDSILVFYKSPAGKALMDKLPGVEMISIGPKIEGPHAPGERLSVSSTGRFYRLLGALLDDLSR